MADFRPKTDKVWPIWCDQVSLVLKSLQNLFYDKRTKIRDFMSKKCGKSKILCKNCDECYDCEHNYDKYDYCRCQGGCGDLCSTCKRDDY